ncbi:unnamed protein product [Cylindrotheca closterium]|uniref:Uncharacterized protein n=1 Tax=Cylindrotheca closterium TaxID=2856 RepID=A0AAD2G2U8_9STRA|nr:unnamed protein product [Cylindrotheca closterium]
MCKRIDMHQSHVAVSPKDDLIEEIGGKEQYDFLILSFCEKIQEESELEEIFCHLDTEVLASRMNSLVDVAFALTESRCQDEKLRNDVLLKNYSLLELGLYASHFEILQQMFEAALHESWIEAEAFDRCKTRFEMLRNIIAEDGVGMEEIALSHRVAEVRILAAKSA